MTATLRSRGREILRFELADAAADFCATRGFDSVTVEDIAQAIGVSRATFFRYFASKEEAIVLSLRLGRRTLPEQVLAAPAPSGSQAMEIVRSAMEQTVEQARRQPDILRARMDMISASANLRGSLASERAEQRRELVAALQHLLGDEDAAQAVAHGSMAAIDLAWSSWRNRTGGDLGEELDRAFGLITDLGNLRIGDEASMG